MKTLPRIRAKLIKWVLSMDETDRLKRRKKSNDEIDGQYYTCAYMWKKGKKERIVRSRLTHRSTNQIPWQATYVMSEVYQRLALCFIPGVCPGSAPLRASLVTSLIRVTLSRVGSFCWIKEKGRLSLCENEKTNEFFFLSVERFQRACHELLNFVNGWKREK